jgi:hypothetical protein
MKLTDHRFLVQNSGMSQAELEQKKCHALLLGVSLGMYLKGQKYIKMSHFQERSHICSLEQKSNPIILINETFMLSNECVSFIYIYINVTF